MKIALAAALLACLLTHPSGGAGLQAARSPAYPAREERTGQQVISVGEDRSVSVEAADLPLVEPHLAVNPKDPNNMIVGAMALRPDGNYTSFVFTSLDGGGTWKRHDFGLGIAGDVWVAFLPDGAAVFSTVTDTPEAEAVTQVFRSADGGRTWPTKPVTLGGVHDHPTLVVDRTGRKFAGSLYVISSSYRRSGATGKSRNSIFVARSADGGASFLPPTHVIASNLSYEPHNPALLSDGTLLVPFADHHSPGRRRRLERQRDWLVTSTDGGQTFSEPLFIAETCDGSGGWSSLAAGAPAGPFPDRIYHVCAARQFDGILVRRSDTRGETWSEPVRVDRPGDVTPYTRTPAITVNKDGVVGVAWYDGRGDRSTIKGNFRCHEIFFAASPDGGETFLPEVKVSAQKSCPAAPRNVEAALRFPAGGEYIGLVAAPDGAFRLVWSDARSGIYQLRTATVSVGAKAANR